MRAIEELLNRRPLKSPTILMPSFSSLEELLSLNSKEFKLENYQHGGVILAPMAK